MKQFRAKFLPLSILILAAATSIPRGDAQAVSLTRILSNPDGPWFYVDGTAYYHAMSVFWPVGSVHRLSSPYNGGYNFNADQTIQYQFTGWQWVGGSFADSTIQVTADPAITQYTANYSMQYLFTLQFGCNPAPCTGSPGFVLVQGRAVTANQSTWQSPNSTVTLQAYPSPGWIFAGWQAAPNQSITGFQNTVSMASPVTVQAIFVPAAPVQLTTTPLNLLVYADHELVSTPATMQWGEATTHSLGALNLQNDTDGKYWVFASWSDGGAFTHNYTAPKNTLPVTVTAVYAPAAYPYFLTSPPFLNLVIDGQTLPPPYGFVWGVGSTHKVTAPTTQTDGGGNTWTFKSWDDGVTTATRSITIPAGADVNGYRLTALYSSQAHLTVNGTVAGMTVSVDGTTCATPCSVYRDMGTQVHVSAPASIPMSANSRQDFLGWSTSAGVPAPGDWVATLNTASTSITASYHLMNQLTASANPAGGASWSISPASTDGFYDAQTSVKIGVTPQPGYRFNGWGGDLSGSTPSASLAMTAPHAVVAQFNPVPYIAPPGVNNAAGLTPQNGLAAGGVASIFGVNLASSTAIGASSPMVQSLAGTTAHIGDRLLPLYFASPTQINLQIPPDLPPGPQTLTVSSPGMPDTSTNFTVLRNAPGLFPLMLDGRSYALVLHQDGSLVTPESPAQKGETLTLYASGLGPTTPARPEGIAVPQSPAYQTVDAVSLQVGTVNYPAQNAVAAAGMVGLDLVQFQLDSSAPSGASIPLYLTVNGVSSNTLSLPIQ